MCPATVGNYAHATEEMGLEKGTPIILFHGDIMPGYSGGPLMDLDGGLIGVVVAKLKQPEKAGIAISASLLLKDINRLAQTEEKPVP